MTDPEQITIERCANTLRGMTMDPRIPTEIKSVMHSLIDDLEALIEDDDEEPDPDRLREDRDERRRLERNDQ